MSEKRYTVKPDNGWWWIYFDDVKQKGVSAYWASMAQAEEACDALNAAYEAGRDRPRTDFEWMNKPKSAPVTPAEFCADPKGNFDDRGYRCSCFQCGRRRARKMELRRMAEDKAQAKHDRKYKPVTTKPFLKARSQVWNFMQAVFVLASILAFAKNADLKNDNAALSARVEQLAKYEDGVITQYVTDTIHPNTFGGDRLTIINAILPYYGGKRTLAPKIVKLLGCRPGFFEPFCGSLAVLFHKSRSSSETVNDLYGDVVNLARQVQSDRGPELWERTQRTLMCKPTFEESCEEIAKPFEPTFDRAFHFIVACWQGLNGLTGAARANPIFNLRYAPNGGSPSTRWNSVVSSIPFWWQRLQNVTILQECGISLCERIADSDQTAIYCDPPYFMKRPGYIFDFMGDDHERLAHALRRFKKTRVVLSYYAHAEVDRLYPDWTRVECTMRKNIATIGGNGSGDMEAPEILLVNGANEE